jgi:flavin-binding protein dodecin
MAAAAKRVSVFPTFGAAPSCPLIDCTHARAPNRGACLAATSWQIESHVNPPQSKENIMSEHVYKMIELTGSSTQSSDDAVRVALTKASKTLRNMHWFEVVETRGHIEEGKVLHWQVTLKVGLRLEE